MFREIEHVIEELKTIARTHGGVNRIFFVDTEFNVPDFSYGTSLVRRIIEEGLNERFRFSSQFLPRPFDAAFAAGLSKKSVLLIFLKDGSKPIILK